MARKSAYGRDGIWILRVAFEHSCVRSPSYVVGPFPTTITPNGVHKLTDMKRQELSASQRASILALSRQGLSLAQIRVQMQLSKSTIASTVRRFKERDTLDSAQRSGRPVTWTATSDRYRMREMRKRPTASWKQLSELSDVSVPKLRRTAYRHGIYRTKARKTHTQAEDAMQRNEGERHVGKRRGRSTDAEQTPARLQ